MLNPTPEQLADLIDALKHCRAMLKRGKYGPSPIDGKPSSANPQYWINTEDADKAAPMIYNALKPFLKKNEQ